jgi:predicted ATPase
MQHLKGFGLENFRVFKDYTWFDLAPITLLIGPNSSGKSSLTKGLSLFKDSIKFNEYNTFGSATRKKYPKKEERKASYQQTLETSLGRLFTVDFDKSELTLQTGGINRVFHCNSEDKIPQKKELKFTFPHSLQNFPTFDVWSKAECFIIISAGSIVTEIGIELDHRKIIWRDEKKLYFDTDFLNYLELHDEYNFDLDAFLRISSEHHPSIDDDFKREIYENFENIKEFYKKNRFSETGIISQELYYSIEITEDDRKRSNFPDEIINYRKSVENPFEKLLQQIDLPAYLIKWIDIMVLEFSDNVSISPRSFLSLTWLFRCENIIHVHGVKERIKRSYLKEEETFFNTLIKNYLSIIEDEKGGSIGDGYRLDFIEYWCENNGFKLNGEIKPIVEDKYNIQTIELGLRSLVEEGFGISQILSLLLGISNNLFKNAIIICEEPEANLHPAFQSKLADMFLDAQKRLSKQFIIETHSEYMVRKFQYLVAKGEMKKEDIVIYYFNDPNNIPVGEPQVKKIEILEDGSLSDDFGSGFFDEATNWKFELLKLKKTQQN